MLYGNSHHLSPNSCLCYPAIIIPHSIVFLRMRWQNKISHTGLALAYLFVVAVKLYVSREIFNNGVIPPSSKEIHVTSIITLFAVLAKPYNMHIYLSHRVKHAERLSELYLNE